MSGLLVKSLAVATPCGLTITCRQPLIAADVRVWLASETALADVRYFRMLPSRVLRKTRVLEGDAQYTPLVTAAVITEMTNKGLTQVTAIEDIEESAGFFTTAIPQIEATVFYWFGVDPRGASIGRYNHAATVAVHLINPKTQQSVWAALSSAPAGRASSLKSNIDKATRALFKKYLRR